MKPRILPDDLLAELARRHGTPLYVYDVGTVLARFERLAGFDVVRYAQKANSAIALLARLRAAGAEVDAVSAGEIHRALRAGFAPGEIVFTADLFDQGALALVGEHAIAVNAGSPGMLDEVAGVAPGCAVTLRVNPGFGDGHSHKVSTGGPWSKHGIWHAELTQVAARARRLGLAVSGLHVHIGSGADLANIERTAEAMLGFARAVPEELRTISAGGGLAVPYRADEPAPDVARYTRIWQDVQATLAGELGHPLRLETEPGRFLVAEAGLLLTEVRAVKSAGDVDYVLVDAGFHTLVRPALYGSYHQISALGKGGEAVRPRVVAGPLCESSDVFTQDESGRPAPQPLPAVGPGDLLCVHDVGAYGASMASNYNSRLLPAEVLVDKGEAQLIRRRQSYAELLAGETEPEGREHVRKGRST